MLVKRSLLLTSLMVIMLILNITGCGGGSGSSFYNPIENNQTTPLPDFKTPKTIGGYWEGYLYSETLDQYYQVYALASEYDEIRIVDINGSQIFGTALVDESVLLAPAGWTGNLIALASPYVTFHDGTTSGAFNVNGVISQRNTLQGNWIGLGESGTMDLTFDEIYNRDSSLDILSGLWLLPQLYGLDVNILLTIQNDGTITGHDALLSTWTGNVEIIASEFNMYRVNVTETTIGGIEYNYSGLMSLEDSAAENDTFVLAANSDNLSLQGFFSRQ